MDVTLKASVIHCFLFLVQGACITVHVFSFIYLENYTN